MTEETKAPDGAPAGVSDSTQLLAGITVKRMLTNAHALLRHKYRKTPLWALVVDVCGVGSTRGAQICREFGWNPDQDGSKRLP